MVASSRQLQRLPECDELSAGQVSCLYRSSRQVTVGFTPNHNRCRDGLFPSCATWATALIRKGDCMGPQVSPPEGIVPSGGGSAFQLSPSKCTNGTSVELVG